MSTTGKWSKIALASQTIILATVIGLPIFVSTEANFEDKATSNIQVSSDSISAPTNLKVASVTVGQTDLSWTASPSTFTTGYRIYRAESAYGPWAAIADVSGRTTVKYIDKNIGTKKWFYRVESTWDNWVSTSPGYEAPPAVGRSFYDTFKTLGNLDGRITGDGSSVWQVWSGSISVQNNPGGVSAFGSGYIAGATPRPAVAVVRTPTQDARIFEADFDGSEGVVLRGKDPLNYIYVGGAVGGKSDDGSFEISEYRNGVRTVLKSISSGPTNKDFRIEIQGNQIRAYVDAKNGVNTSGTLYMSATSDFLYGDPTATYFGIGFNGDFGNMGFYFDAY